MGWLIVYSYTVSTMRYIDDFIYIMTENSKCTSTAHPLSL